MSLAFAARFAGMGYIPGMITVNRSPLRSKDQTGRAMYSLAVSFADDLGTLAGEKLSKFYNRVKNIPYQRDPKGLETIARPGLLLKEFPSLDCKKKAILMAAFFRKNKKPFRFVAVSEIPSKKIHHVFVQVFLRGQWRNVDATYSKYKLFEPKPRITRAEILKA